MSKAYKQMLNINKEENRKTLEYKQDALEELKRVYNKLTFRMLKSEDSIKYRDEIGDFIIKRIKELECEKE